jgi:hypothetical protein
MLLLATVAWLPKEALAGACSMRMWRQSASSSSATIMGRLVATP